MDEEIPLRAGMTLEVLLFEIYFFYTSIFDEGGTFYV
nr:MAG TPA: hypothetical protein [Caudoviricetes sp.]